jgi:serine phosphatase RsbU (regulator of sigma subunit)
MSSGERALDALLRDAHLTPAHELPGLLARHAAVLGVTDMVMYLADLQQAVLVPVPNPERTDPSAPAEPLGIDSTVAGRAFQHIEVLLQEAEPEGGGALLWLPMLDGTERVGVLAVTVADRAALAANDRILERRLQRFASLAAELVLTKTQYGDSLVRVRRTAPMKLPAELQWSLLPPLTFATDALIIAAALEPAYDVAGDSVDYAVDPGLARVALFDAMGHGLQSAQLAIVSIAAYRNARRSGKSLSDTARGIDAAVYEGFGGEAFTTAVLAELETDTGRLSWINAGHPEPLLLRRSRLVKSLRSEPVLPFGLGLDEAAAGGGRITVGHEQLESGDRVLLYTDGVTEARSPTGEFFGVEQLADLLGRNLAAGLPTPETMRRMIRSLLEHQQGRLDDDATMLLLEWRSGKEQALLP